MQQGRRDYLANNVLDQQARQGQLWNQAFGGQSEDRMSPQARALREATPEHLRGVMALAGPQQGYSGLLQAIQTDRNQRQTMEALSGLGLGGTSSTAPAAPSAPRAEAPAGSTEPRGLRNNNPLNIEAGPFAQGQPGFTGSDGRFARFETPQQGVEAADRLLQSYAARGLTTPIAIVSRWAPAGDGNNNPTAYANAVAQKMGVRADQPINMADPGVRQQLISAMAEMENGRPLPAMQPSGNAVGVTGNQAMRLMMTGAATGNPTLMQLGQGLATLANRDNTVTGIGPNQTIFRNGVPVGQTPRDPSDTERFMSRYRELINRGEENLTPAEQRELRTLEGRLGERQTLMERGPSVYDQERAKTLAEVIKGIETAGRGATNTLMRVGQIERDLERFTTGATSGAQITAGQIAQRLGLPNSVLAPLGLDANTTAAGENIRSLGFQMIQAQLASGEFPSNNFSNADLATLQQSNPGLFNSPEGNRAIARTVRAIADRNAEVWRAWREWQTANGDGIESARRFQNERLPDIVSRDILAPILKDFGGQPAQATSPQVQGRDALLSPMTAGPGGIGVATPPPPPPSGGGWSIRPVR